MNIDNEKTMERGALRIEARRKASLPIHLLLRVHLCLSVVLLTLLTACAPQTPDCALIDVFCAGLVTDYGSIDTGLAHQAWLGLQDALGKHFVDRVDYIETVDTRDRAANIRYFTDAHYDLIVTVGAVMADDTTAAAMAYPSEFFIGVEQPQKDKLPNLAGLVFHEEQSGYMAGALAALMTETGHVAAICEASYIQQMRRYCDGFKAGAQYTLKSVNVSVTYRQGSTNLLFNDPEWGRKTALQAVQDGADVVFAAGASTADAALQAAAGAGAYVIGSETDVYGSLALLRPQLLTSATNDVRSGVLTIIRRTRRNDFPAGQFTGSVKLAPWHDLDRQIPTDVKQKIQKIQAAFDAGTLETGVSYAGPVPTVRPGATAHP
jgi:basic membrane protein A